MPRMRRIRFGKPSPALALAAVALFVALGGPASAARTIKKALFAKQAANARKVDGLSASRKPKRNTLLALDKKGKFPASVLPPGIGSSHTVQGVQGPPGDHGFVGTPGSALAYSRIFFAPPDEGGPPQWRADDKFSKRVDNDENFHQVGPGEYCFHDLAFKINNAVATMGGTLSKAFTVSVDFGKDGALAPLACNAGDRSASWAKVYVYDLTTPASPALADPADTNEVYVSFN